MDQTHIYLAILEDRHFDIKIEAFTNLVKALKEITEWQHNYTDESWEESEIQDYEYYVASECDDGPKMWVESKILK